MSQWYDCLIGFGANLGDPEAAFQTAKAALSRSVEIRQFQSSSPRLTTAIGATSQPSYLNAVFRLQTRLTPQQLHQQLAKLEFEAGRQRRGRWQPRTLDLDLLLYGTERVQTENLQVPHPRMTVRRFVLEPAEEIAGDMFHPIAGQTLGQLLQRLNQQPKRLVWVTDQWALAQQVVEDMGDHSIPAAQNSLADLAAMETGPPKPTPGPAASTEAADPLPPSAAARRSWSLPTGWSIELAGDLTSFESLMTVARIVAWANPRPQGMERAQFAGPQIELPPSGTALAANLSDSLIAVLRSELMAAMQSAS